MELFMTRCVECGSDKLESFLDTIEIEVDGKSLVIPNIDSIRCVNCNETYTGVAANRYIDNQIEIFKANGFDNRLKDVLKSKGITYEDLGNKLGVTKQRVSQIVKDYNPDVQTMYRISSALDEPLFNIYSFNRITQRSDKKYSIDTE